LRIWEIHQSKKHPWGNVKKKKKKSRRGKKDREREGRVRKVIGPTPVTCQKSQRLNHLTSGKKRPPQKLEKKSQSGERYPPGVRGIEKKFKIKATIQGGTNAFGWGC